MPGTFSQIYLHLVFRVIQNQIDKSFQDQLYSYIGGILKKYNHKPLAIGGTSDHIHIFFGYKITQNIPDLVRTIKTGSSNFIRESNFLKYRFSWQEGYGIFSYSQSHISSVINYIHKQDEHHRKKSFKDEYIELLKKFDVNFEEKYL